MAENKKKKEMTEEEKYEENNAYINNNPRTDESTYSHAINDNHPEND